MPSLEIGELAPGKAKKGAKIRKGRGRPPTWGRTLRCLSALGGYAPVRELVRSLAGAQLSPVPESTVRTHIKNLQKLGVTVFCKLKMVPLAEQNLAESILGRILKIVLGERAGNLNQKVVHFPDKFSPHEIFGLLLFTWVTYHVQTTLSDIHTNPYLIAAYFVSSIFFVAVLTFRLVGGIIVRKKLGLSSCIKLRISTPHGKFVVKKFPLNKTVADVIRWAASRLYRDYETDVSNYSLLIYHNNKEFPKFAHLWELDELWECEHNGVAKEHHLKLVRRKWDNTRLR